MTGNKNLMKEAVMQIVAGGTAGFTEICIMQPLDVVKTRLQLQATSNVKPRADDAYHYRGVVDCLWKMYRSEGILAMWKGILPPILSETPKKAIKFLTFEQYKKLFLFGSNKPSPLTFSLAGFCAGITEAFVVNPFEVVKVTLQSNKALASQAPSTWSVAKKIAREQGLGLKGLNKGLFATVARNGVFNMVYFGFYHSVKGYVKKFQFFLSMDDEDFWMVMDRSPRCTTNIIFNARNRYVQRKINRLRNTADQDGDLEIAILFKSSMKN